MMRQYELVERVLERDLHGHVHVLALLRFELQVADAEGHPLLLVPEHLEDEVVGTAARVLHGHGECEGLVLLDGLGL